MEHVLRRIPCQLLTRASSHGLLLPPTCLRHLTQADMPSINPPKDDAKDKAGTSKHGPIRMTGAGPLTTKSTDATTTSFRDSKDLKQPRFVTRDSDSLSKLMNKASEKVRMTEAGPLASKSTEKTRMTEAGPLTGSPTKKSDQHSADSDRNSDWKTGTATSNSTAQSRSSVSDKEVNTKERYGLESTKAWQIQGFGDINSLQLVDQVNVPMLADPFDLLVEIHAASINPFDVARTRGYGENLIHHMRDLSKFSWIPRLPDLASLFSRKDDPFPLTLGRDFSGKVIDSGKMVKGVRAGDEVYGVIGPQRQGTLAQYASTSTWCVARKPKNVSHAEAASIPYVACTTWSVMKLVQNLPNRNREDTRVLMLGASGGIGTFSVQYLKTLGVHVTAVCGTDGVELVESLGADDVIDYKISTVEKELEMRDRYDVIFQASGHNYDHLKKFLKGNLKSFFVTLNYPLLNNSDKLGSIPGLLKSGADFSLDYFKGLANGSHTIWAFFTPNGSFLEEVTGLIEDGRIKPIVGKKFSFDEVPKAFSEVDAGSSNGKVVVKVRKD